MNIFKLKSNYKIRWKTNSGLLTIAKVFRQIIKIDYKPEYTFNFAKIYCYVK